MNKDDNDIHMQLWNRPRCLHLLPSVVVLYTFGQVYKYSVTIICFLPFVLVAYKIILCRSNGMTREKWPWNRAKKSFIIIRFSRKCINTPLDNYVCVHQMQQQRQLDKSMRKQQNTVLHTYMSKFNVNCKGTSQQRCYFCVLSPLSPYYFL